MSRFLSAVMAAVLLTVAIIIGLLSCSPVNIVGTALGNLSTFLTGLPSTALCYPLFPSIVGTVAGILFTVLGGVAIYATLLG